MLCCITGFHPIRPRYEIDQETILDWIAKTHARAAESSEKCNYAESYRQIRERISQLGVGSECIEKRGVHIRDIFQTDLQEREIYPVITHPRGKGFTERSQFFDREVSPILEAFYEEDSPLPPHLIHVTCTGYVAPSPAQKLVSSKKAGHQTTVTHAYHMGCYAALSAIRMGSGFLRLPSSKPAVDVIHTELCTLHLQPLRYSTEQLIVQSLFADGFIKYTLVREANQPHLKVVALLEEIIPESSHCMTWRCEDHGLGMTLSKEVPVRIARSLEGYLERLSHCSGIDHEQIKREALFAIHPGGPKILQHVAQILSLSPFQIQHSAQVLRHFGNMSSATLPHIWEKMQEDPAISDGAYIVSLAFGPGLSLSGGLLQKNPHSYYS